MSEEDEEITAYGVESLINAAYLRIFEPDLITIWLTPYEQGDPDYFINQLIEVSFIPVKNSLETRGFIDAKTPTTESVKLKNLHAYKTLELIYSRGLKEQGDNALALSQKYADLYIGELNQIKLHQDNDKDGRIDETEENQRGGYTVDR